MPVFERAGFRVVVGARREAAFAGHHDIAFATMSPTCAQLQISGFGVEAARAVRAAYDGGRDGAGVPGRMPPVVTPVPAIRCQAARRSDDRARLTVRAVHATQAEGRAGSPSVCRRRSRSDTLARIRWRARDTR